MKPIRIQIWPNVDVRTYYVRFQTADGYKSWELSHGYSNFGTPEEPCEVVDKIAAVEGVDAVRAHNHEVSVTRARAFDWDEIEPRILEILGAMYPANGVEHLPELEEQNRASARDLD